ncbi:hypothetical protein Tco_1479486 [Tanacetum coccineum]
MVFLCSGMKEAIYGFNDILSKTKKKGSGGFAGGRKKLKTRMTALDKAKAAQAAEATELLKQWNWKTDVFHSNETN